MSRIKLPIFFLGICILFICIPAFAVSSSEVAANIDDLMTKIHQVNQDLAEKSAQQQRLERAITDSDMAISQSTHLLKQIKQKRDLDLAQLKELASVLPEMQKTTQILQQNVATTISKLYQQLTVISLESSSIMVENSTLSSRRKKIYLISLLKAEQAKYQELAAKLQQLNDLNLKLSTEVSSLTKKLGSTSAYDEKLYAQKQQQLATSIHLHNEISAETQMLYNLKQKQAALSRLLIAIASTERLAATEDAHQHSSGTQNTHIWNDSSAFFGRRLFKPVVATVLVPYGAMRRGVRNNGLLLNTQDNAAIFSISDGRVMYAGNLAGFGQIIVINHGDNYMSIYGGILPKVKQNQIVHAGEIIASGGNIGNQPMGGVYFELRHRGNPVNPSFLVK